MKDKDIESLKWIRIFSPVHIPKSLIEQIRDRDFTVEDFYKYQESVCLIPTDKGPILNPTNHLYILSDKDNQVKGILWFTVDTLSKDICINVFSMDKEYWCKGKAVKMISEFIKDFRKKANLNKVYWTTNYPLHSMRYGFKRSKAVLMEYDPKQEEEVKKVIKIA